MSQLKVGRNAAALARYLKLPRKTNAILAEYVWIGGKADLRSKTRVLPNRVNKVSDLPKWSFDGSSTGQATGENSEVKLQPVKIIDDPFRRGDNIIVLCECYDPSVEPNTPLPSNHRAFAREIFENPKVQATDSWFALEQEYTFFNIDGIRPLGFPSVGLPEEAQGPYYCGIGVSHAVGRDVVEAHFAACLYAGLHVGGINAEVMPGQWEYQIGPCNGLDASDDLWLSRYLLERICEDFEIRVSFDPKPLPDWNGAGCHCNFSTEAMRKDGGWDHIIKAVEKLAEKHKEHMAVYGVGNEKRMTGKHETADFNKFSWAVANRGTSVRITRETEKAKKGFLEDRRPAANCDPYAVTGMIAQTTIVTI